MSEDLTTLSERALRKRASGGFLAQLRKRRVLPFEFVRRAFATAELERRAEAPDLSQPTVELMKLRTEAEGHVLSPEQLGSMIGLAGQGGSARLLIEDYKARYLLLALDPAVDARLSAPAARTPLLRPSALAERALFSM
jgi:hypothetical protein